MSEERLGARHAEILQAFESSYPEGMRVGVERLREKLGWLEESRFSFSWILFEEGEAKSYIVAYPSKSQIDVPKPPTVVLIDDLMVEPDRPHDFYRLLRLMVDDMEEQDLAHLTIEANCRRTAYEVVRDHPRVISRLGYEMQGQYEYWEPGIGEEMCWVRFVPLRAPEVIAEDRFTFSADLLEELRWSENTWSRSR